MLSARALRFIPLYFRGPDGDGLTWAERNGSVVNPGKVHSAQPTVAAVASASTIAVEPARVPSEPEP